MRKSKRPYKGFPNFPDLYNGDERIFRSMPHDYPDGPVGEGIDRIHRLNRFALQYGCSFIGGDHMARFQIHEFLGTRISLMPCYVRAVEGLTVHQLFEYYRIFFQEAAPECAFINIGLEEMKQPEFDAHAVVTEIRETLIRFCTACPPIKRLYLIAFFPVCPEMATDETREALKNLTNERIAEMNRELQALTKEWPEVTPIQTLEYLDLNAPLTAPNGKLRKYLTDDGIHLTPDAYFRVFEQIKDIFSDPPRPTGGPCPVDNTLRFMGRIQALADYIIEKGYNDEDGVLDFLAMRELRGYTMKDKMNALVRYLPIADLKEIAKYIVYYTDNPIDVMRTYCPEAFMEAELEADRHADLIEFPIKRDPDADTEIESETDSDSDGGDDK